MVQLLLTVALWSAVQMSGFSVYSRAEPAPVASPSVSSGIPQELQSAGITEKLGNRIPIQSLTFTNEEGVEVPLSTYFSRGRPVVVAMVYYECPNLCNFLLNGLTDTLKKMDWVPGNQFEIVAVSIDPREGAELAAKKKAAYLASYGRTETEGGWHLLTGKESQIKQLAFELGFGYNYDEKEKQYAHSAALFVLTPEGQLSRILYGIEFKPRDLRLALVEAADGKVGSVVDRFLLFCYRYDPSLRSYSVYLFNVMRVAGLITALTMMVMLGLFWRRQLKARA
jgi:protein SCO1/2